MKFCRWSDNMLHWTSDRGAGEVIYSDSSKNVSPLPVGLGKNSLPKSFYLGLMMLWASQVALVVKNPPANAGDVRDKRLIPGLGRWPRAGHGNPLQYSCLENPMDRRAWQTTVHGVTKSRTWLRRLRTCAPTNTRIQDQTKNTSGFQDGP